MTELPRPDMARFTSYGVRLAWQGNDSIQNVVFGVEFETPEYLRAGIRNNRDGVTAVEQFGTDWEAAAEWVRQSP